MTCGVVGRRLRLAPLQAFTFSGNARRKTRARLAGRSAAVSSAAVRASGSRPGALLPDLLPLPPQGWERCRRRGTELGGRAAGSRAGGGSERRTRRAGRRMRRANVIHQRGARGGCWARRVSGGGPACARRRRRRAAGPLGSGGCGSCGMRRRDGQRRRARAQSRAGEVTGSKVWSLGNEERAPAGARKL